MCIIFGFTSIYKTENKILKQQNNIKPQSYQKNENTKNYAFPIWNLETTNADPEQPTNDLRLTSFVSSIKQMRNLLNKKEKQTLIQSKNR